MKDSQTLEILQAIESGNVLWDVIGSRVIFATKTTNPYRPERGPEGIHKLSERLFHRDDFETEKRGTVSLTNAGERLLDELRKESTGN